MDKPQSSTYVARVTSDGTGEAKKLQAQQAADRVKRWNVWCLYAIRCLTSAAGGFVMISSGELLVRVFKGDTARAQGVMTALTTSSIVTSFLSGPIAGALIDSYGRKVGSW